MKKRRLDEVLIADDLVRDTKEAFIIVTEGRVFVDGHKAISPALFIASGAVVDVKSSQGYVGRGAYKLEAALDRFGVDPAGKVCVDVGAATGGFTEVLLRRGAEKVYAIDTARGKIALKIREDPRVIVMERTDIRHFEGLPDAMDLAVIDVSLISLRGILSSVRRLMKPMGSIVALFKPQYETRDATILHHGVIRDPVEREKLIADFIEWAKENGWQIKSTMVSPIRGDKGNGEYLVHLMGRK